MLSNTIMIRLYLSSGQESFTLATGTPLAIEHLLQLFIVFKQHRKKSLLQFSFEVLAVLTFMKPGLDVYRVASGATLDKILVPYMDETNFMRCFELFTEALSGIVIQLLAIVKGSEQGVIPILSSMSCVFSAALISACFSYKKDTDPGIRASAPFFYGFVPNDKSGKIKVFLIMTLIASTLIIARAFAFVLLIVSDGADCLFYTILTDVALFFAYKLARGDFLYW